MDREQQERLKVRDFNKNLLLAILNEDSLGFERENSMQNLISQMAIRATIRCAEQLIQVSYRDPEPKTTLMDMICLERKKGQYQIILNSAIEYNFIACRKAMILMIRDMDAEQVYDLNRIVLCNVPEINDDDCYLISCRTTE